MKRCMGCNDALFSEDVRRGNLRCSDCENDAALRELVAAHVEHTTLLLWDHEHDRQLIVPRRAVALRRIGAAVARLKDIGRPVG